MSQHETEVEPSGYSAAAQPEIEHDRQVQPVDNEEPPRLSFPVVGIGASAGGLEAYSELLKATRADTGMAFVLIQHLPPDRESMVAEILSKKTAMPVLQVENGMPVKPNHVYVIRPGNTLTIKNGKLHLGLRTESPGHSRPVDDFFKSLAEEQRERGIAIILSGMGSNGTAGAQAIKAVGGLCIAQDPESAQFPSMPRHLIEAGYADYILRPQDMPEVLLAYVGHPYATGSGENARILVARDASHLREILAVLRTRTTQDFTGYKKPTILRRVQRRMGINRVQQISDYAKILRQSPGEVTALADDLLIHVTGFFRDAEVWQTLREKVIVPLIASRDSDSTVRCWVTACSSGEEAYSLAILIVEEAERTGKRLDIKVFATDMAERSLQNARHGLFPGGIESEITPGRLERFFTKEDAMYRVRPDLRERVVFAPQNVLQDPPFSRLDIVSCRNLLIYLEPEVQRRLMSLLHFGLREGGTLLLGTSETISGAEELFEPIDKHARIFRRVGPTRHGMVDFPLPHGMEKTSTGDGTRSESRTGARPSVSTLTTRALLEHHMPAAVTVDRDFRIIYFQGNTDLFLTQPRGEATRDLFSMARENVRGAVRTALHRAAAENAPVTVLDGFLETKEGVRQRIAVTASPLDAKLAPDFYVVSFQERGEAAPAAPPGLKRGNGEVLSADAELVRVRDELQSAVEELQTGNEELKASHEEVVSMNEELQSTNEELETSREEMQSLNEELTTVNAQLHAKMEEHQAARNDLTSLLASTDIAVLFLDTKFRIRRFTPAVKDLLDMIQGDVGRPLSDLAQKFSDPELVRDSESVLERLIPVQREIGADGGRWFMRRILPYRTADNRIDGVVVTFVDITDRKRSEAERIELLKREKAARVEAESANRVKDEFLATVSHELRTPLSAIMLWANVLTQTSPGANEISEGLSAIKGSAEAQRELVNDLLDTSRIISGNLRLHIRKVDLLAMIQDAAEAILPLAAAKNITATAKLDENIGLVGADAERLRQVIWNLLTNAIKFTTDGGKVELSARRIDREIEIRVADTGIGIAPEFLPIVFDRFRQADSSSTRSQSGLGLGLTISKQLVELHGGTIIASSPGRGLGATFTIRLPLAPIPRDGHSSRKEADIPRPIPVSLDGVRILVVEDDAATRTALKALLENFHAAVTAVDCAAAALESIEGERPDLIVSDIGLPSVNGYQFIRQLRQREARAGLAPVPAVALTAFARDEDRQLALEAGFHHHIAKPADTDTLISVLHQLLETR
jgi:two-component system CheB/CheR fusion protein